MERLTAERCNGIKTGYWSTYKKEDIVQRLGAYEDTGMTPKEIKDALKLLDEYKNLGTIDEIREALSWQAL